MHWKVELFQRGVNKNFMAEMSIYWPKCGFIGRFDDPV